MRISRLRLLSRLRRSRSRVRFRVTLVWRAYEEKPGRGRGLAVGVKALWSAHQADSRSRPDRALRRWRGSQDVRMTFRRRPSQNSSPRTDPVAINGRADTEASASASPSVGGSSRSGRISASVMRSTSGVEKRSGRPRIHATVFTGPSTPSTRPSNASAITSPTSTRSIDSVQTRKDTPDRRTSICRRVGVSPR